VDEEAEGRVFEVYGVSKIPDSELKMRGHKFSKSRFLSWKLEWVVDERGRELRGISVFGVKMGI
jgi:hypothetical protein